MSATITLAKQSPSGIITHIEEVEKGKPDIFICVGCNQDVIVVKSEARKKDWHFRHKVESDCSGAKDTALHDFAVQLILEANTISLRKGLDISYTTARKEVSVFNKRSDVTVIYQNEDVHFEIFVSHDVDEEKKNVYRHNKIKSVRIDLSGKMLLSADVNVIRQATLTNIKNKSLIYWNDSELPEERGNFDGWALVKGFFAFFGLVLLLRFLFKKRKRY